MCKNTEQKGRKNMNNKKFEQLCKMSQKGMKRHLIKQLQANGRQVIHGKGWIYSEGKLPILVCAHMDTVHKHLPKSFVYEKGKVSSPQGIGGDDRCGIYMILEIIKKLDVKVAFFEDEEIGGIGSTEFTKTETIKSIDVNYVIELDRKGNKDAVFYDCDNPKFTNFVTEKYWKEAYGSYTDICNICPVMGVAGVNLSCGYYNAHTLDEYVVTKELDKTISEVIKLIERSGEEKFEYIEAKYNKYWNYGYNYGYGYGDSYDYGNYDYSYSYSYKNKGKGKNSWFEGEYEISFMTNNGEQYCYYDAMSEYEALGMFMCDYPDKSFNDVVSIQMM